MAVDLEAWDAILDATTLALLGDTVVYTPQGGAPLTLKVLADYSDGEKMLGNSRVITSEAAMEVAVADVPQPTGQDLIFSGRVNQNFHPKDAKLDETGRNWLILLKRSTIPVGA